MKNKENEKDFEVILQNALDELFALQTQSKEAQQIFLAESTTLIKTAAKQVEESVQLTTRAEKAAQESVEAAQRANQAAQVYADGLRFWQRTIFWFMMGLLVMGLFFGAVYINLGKQIKYRQDEVDNLQMQYDALSVALKKQKSTSKSASVENHHEEENTTYYN